MSQDESSSMVLARVASDQLRAPPYLGTDILAEAGGRSPLVRSSVSEQFAQRVKRELRSSQPQVVEKKGDGEFTLNKLNLSEVQVVGRDKEVAELLRIFDGRLSSPQNPQDLDKESSPTQPTMVSIAGYSGTGKTVLAQSLRPAVLKASGYFCTGKFDMQQLVEPYTGFISAFTDLAQQILMKEEAFVNDVSRRIQDAVGNEAQVLTDVVPSLSRLMGETDTDATETGVQTRADRLQFIFRQFVRAVCVDRPVVFCLDDLQWADAPSLELLEALVTDIENASFMVVTTSRDNETDSNHPFVQKLSLFEKKEVNVHRMRIENLDSDSVNSIVATALRSSEEMTKPLADIIHNKTHGNAFFVIQFLTLLADEGYLTYNFGTMNWGWKTGEIQSLEVTDNVRGLMMGKLQKLSSQSVLMLQIASCLGQTFEGPLLESVMEKVSSSAIIEDLESAVPVYDTLDTLVDGGLLERRYGSKYWFVHDQIQSAAFSQIPEEKRQLLQLRIGERLLEEFTDQGMDQLLFLAVELFDSSISLLSTIEKYGLAKYNLLAGEKAMRKSAFVPAGKYMESGLAALGADAWSKAHYKLSLDLSIGVVEASYCVGDFDKMQRHIDTVVKVDGPFEDKIQVYLTRILSLGNQERFGEAIDTAIFVLREMGMARLSKFPSQLAVLKEVMKTKLLLRKHTSESLSVLPVLAERKRIQAMGIIYMMSSMTYIASPNLHLIAFLKAVRWSVKYGVCMYSPPAFATYGMILSVVLGDANGAFMIGEVSLEMDERLKARKTLAQTISTVYGYIAPWTNTLHASMKPCLYGHQVGMETGEVEMAMHSLLLHDMTLVLTASRSLETLAPEMETHVHHMREYKQDAFAHFAVLLWQTVLNLSGQNDDPLVLTGKAMNEEHLVSFAIESKNRVIEVLLYSFHMQLAYLFGDYSKAGKYAELSVDFGTKVAHGLMIVQWHYFYRGLTLVVQAGIGREPRKNLRLASQVIQTMEKWISKGNLNCLHMVKLLEAEMAAARRDKRASGLYREAVQKASRAGFLQNKALAHYRAGQFHLTNDKDTYWAAFHFDNAIQCYHDWGAKAMVAHIAENYGKLVAESGNPSKLALEIVKTPEVPF